MKKNYKTIISLILIFLIFNLLFNTYALFTKHNFTNINVFSIFIDFNYTLSLFSTYFIAFGSVFLTIILLNDLKIIDYIINVILRLIRGEYYIYNLIVLIILYIFTSILPISYLNLILIYIFIKIYQRYNISPINSIVYLLILYSTFSFSSVIAINSRQYLYNYFNINVYNDFWQYKIIISILVGFIMYIYMLIYHNRSNLKIERKLCHNKKTIILLIVFLLITSILVLPWHIIIGNNIDVINSHIVNNTFPIYNYLFGKNQLFRYDLTELTIILNIFNILLLLINKIKISDLNKKITRYIQEWFNLLGLLFLMMYLTVLSSNSSIIIEIFKLFQYSGIVQSIELCLKTLFSGLFIGNDINQSYMILSTIKNTNNLLINFNILETLYIFQNFLIICSPVSLLLILLLEKYNIKYIEYLKQHYKLLIGIFIIYLVFTIVMWV